LGDAVPVSVLGEAGPGSSLQPDSVSAALAATGNAPDLPAAPVSLDAWLSSLHDRLYALGSALHDFYFSHQARLQSNGAPA
jgi:hypothetical protein